MLSKEVATTLGGRFFIYDAYPYSFKEYLAAQQVELKELGSMTLSREVR